MRQATTKGTISMSSEVAVPQGSAFDLLKAADTPKARQEAGRYAVEAVPVPDFKYPVPRFFFDLPWADDENGFDDILAQLAAAEDIEAATERKELRKIDEVIGRPVVVLGALARRSEVEADAKWGAYLSLTVSVDGAEPEVLNSGHGEVCVTVWRLYCEGRLPAAGMFVKRGEPKVGRKQPIGFQVEGEL